MVAELLNWKLRRL